MDYSTLVKQFIGKHYTEMILVHLASKNIKNPKGNEYSKDHIERIVNGIKKNNKIEAEILALMKKEKLKKRKQQLIVSSLQDAANLIKTN